jgi:hypothetical protein
MASARTLLVVVLAAATAAQAAEPVSTRITATQPSALAAEANRVDAAQLQALDLEQARIWGLTVAEIQRARVLMQPGTARAAFSAPNLSPIEALGIHAASEAERRRYAELFVKAVHADTERVLAWMASYATTYARLYPNEPAIDFKGQKLPRSVIAP